MARNFLTDFNRERPTKNVNPFLIPIVGNTKNSNIKGDVVLTDKKKL